MKRLNDSQMERISEIASNVGLIFLASTVLPIFTNRSDLTYSILGTLTCLIFWIFSILILKEVKND